MVYQTGVTVQTAANRTHGKLTAPAGQVQCPVTIDILRARLTACAATVWFGKGWWEAPLVKECFANFECRLHDDALVDTYDFFIFEIVAAHVAASPKNPPTLHYQGDGSFMMSGKIISRRSKFQPGML
jgi:hypothetical protein